MATNNPQDSDLSFLEKKDANSLTGKDIFFTILRNLHWLILCALIGAAIAWFHSDRANRIYESHAKIIINSVISAELPQTGRTSISETSSFKTSVVVRCYSYVNLKNRAGMIVLHGQYR